MIEIKNKKDCCGCSACVQKCPKDSISLEEDYEGFLYPKVNIDTCINCGLCEKVCPMLHQEDRLSPQEYLAVKNTNEKDRMNSSSGGIFILLARYIISQGGVVFGAVFDDNWQLHHVCAETLDEVYPMMGSKYIQSRIENTFNEAEVFLKQGRMVLYVGTPCQISGLRHFLHNKEYSNLLLVDILCHGIPSPGVWRSYIGETFGAETKLPPLAATGKNTVLLPSLNAMSPIGDIKFRDKQESGWKKFRFVVLKKSASKADQNSVLLSDIHSSNLYMRGFLTNIYLRPSCYTCKCKNGISHSDFTIGDYWALKSVDKDFDDDKGASLVLCNTPKGIKLLADLKVTMIKTSFEKAKMHNGGFDEMVAEPEERKRFFKAFKRKKGFNQSMIYCFEQSLGQRIRRKVKTFFGK